METSLNAYKGVWLEDILYKKGNIVYVIFNKIPEYYICIMSHYSDNLMLPSKEDVYWNYIDSKFLSQLTFTKTTLPLPLQKKKQIEIYNPSLKRKIEKAEIDIENFCKKNKNNSALLDEDDIRNRILLLNTSLKNKNYILEKFKNLKDPNSSEYAKRISWIKTVLNIPFGILKNYKTPHKNAHFERQLPISHNSTFEELNSFFEHIRLKLNEKIHGMDDVKQNIIEYIAKKISNPNSKGDILALCGTKGIGKTVLLRSLADALNLPFGQINFGGLSDNAILIGHSETYVGAKQGKLVDLLIQFQCINGIVLLDEIDKISKSKEINGVLTHILDEEQNCDFQDNYLGSLSIDLSKLFIVISFNDISKVDHIVSDRMKIIHIDTPSIEEKLIITKTKIIPSIIENTKFPYTISIDDDILFKYIKKHTSTTEGVRQIKKWIEDIINKLNYITMTNDIFNKNFYEKFFLKIIEYTSHSKKLVSILITQKFLDTFFPDKNIYPEFNAMYI
jgi:energy-coupling factor transporter ATP-binding protein EcfA2